MSQETNQDCLFKVEAKGEEVSITCEGGSRDLAMLIAEAAVRSSEINTILKAAMMMIIHHEMEYDEDEEKFQADKEAAVEVAQALFSNKVGQA